MSDALTHARRRLAHWLRTLASAVDPDRVDGFEAALNDLVNGRTP
jgi:hypothetical protein